MSRSMARILLSVSLVPASCFSQQTPTTPPLGVIQGTEHQSDVKVISGLNPEQERIFRKDVLPALMAETQKTWYPFVPTEARPPLFKKGRSAIVFTLRSDGTVSDLGIAEHADVPMDRAAWGAIKQSRYEPFPATLTVPEVRLRFRFAYNEGAQTNAVIPQ